jgi:cystathionine gamma-synthase
VLLGSVSTKDEATFTKLAEHRRLAGAIPGPFEVWLALRGLRTLSVRMDRAQSNALELATRLSKHPLIDKVRYPGLPSDPHHATAKKFMKGFGAIVAFEIKGSPEQADKVTASSELVTFATSLGGVESLWERRHRWSSESASIPKNLIRLSVGIEGVEDLWADIDQALKRGMVPTYILNRRGGGGGRVI